MTEAEKLVHKAMRGTLSHSADQTQRERLARIEAPEPPTPATEQYEYWDESESAVWSLTTGQFLLASILVCMGAIALVL